MSKDQPNALSPVQRLTKEQQVLVAKHTPLAKKKAAYYYAFFCALSKKPSDGDTQGRDTIILRKEDMVSAMYEALCEGALTYDPNYRAKDGTPRTFGVYVQLEMHGKAMALFRKAMKKKVQLPPEEILSGHAPHTDRWSRTDGTMSLIDMIPDKTTLPDGSDYDGGPGEGLSSRDKAKMHEAIASVCNRAGLGQLMPVRQILDMLMKGYDPGEIVRAKSSNKTTNTFTTEEVTAVIGMVREALAPLVSDRARYALVKADKIGTAADQKHVREWIKSSRYPAVLGPDKVWRVTPWTQRAIEQHLGAIKNKSRNMDKAQDPAPVPLAPASKSTDIPRRGIVLF